MLQWTFVRQAVTGRARSQTSDCCQGQRQEHRPKTDNTFALDPHESAVVNHLHPCWCSVNF